MQLYFIRHGQSENNAWWAKHQSEEAPRVPDPALTDIGHQQASHLAQFLAHKTAAAPDPEKRDPYNRSGFYLTHLYTSLMQRAVQTADYISKACDLPMVAWEEIHEWGGIFQKQKESGERQGLPGPNRHYFEQHFPHLQLPDRLQEQGWWNRPYEPFEEAPARVSKVLADLLERHKNTEDRVALVSHGGFGFLLMQALLAFASPGKTLGKPHHIWFSMNNTSISRIDFGSDYLALVYLNRLEHLSGDLIT